MLFYEKYKLFRTLLNFFKQLKKFTFFTYATLNKL